jgi:hypothetical protein
MKNVKLPVLLPGSFWFPKDSFLSHMCSSNLSSMSNTKGAVCHLFLVGVVQREIDSPLHNLITEIHLSCRLLTTNVDSADSDEVFDEFHKDLLEM